MKRNYLLLMLALIMFISCQNQEKTAQRNVKEYLVEKMGEKYQLQADKFSKLYIISPKVEGNIPKANPEDSEELLAWVNLRSSKLRLLIHGCTPEVFSYIVDNDKKLNKFNTGGKEYAMLCFLKCKDKYMNEEEVGFCAVLDSVYNVSEMYKIHDINKIRAIMAK